MNRFALTLVPLVLLGVAAITGNAKPKPVPADVAPVAPVASGLMFADLTGKRYTDADLKIAKASVFFFTANECPIAAQYAGRMNTVAQEFMAKGVRFFVVNSSTANTKADWAKYVAQRRFVMPAVKDNKTALADALGAQMTPSAVVLDASLGIRYIGRIDDNPDKTRVRRSELREAVEAVLAGTPVKVTRNRPLGCAIWRDNAASDAKTTTITYARDIAPLLNKNCVVCHRAGDVAPFSLQTYAQAKQWSAAIKEYTKRRIMPPWKAVEGQANWFHDARYLTTAQINTIAKWSDGGAPAGNLKQVPPAPIFSAPGDWRLGKPDAVLQPVGSYHLAAEGDDVYRNFTLPIDFDKDTYVSAFDFMPGNRKIVHHIIAYIDVDGKTVLRKDNKESEPGWNVSGGGSGIQNYDWGAGWAAGNEARRYEPGLAIKIPKGAKLVLQVHYHKTGLPEEDRTKLALYYSKEPVKQILHTAAVGSPWIYIKPNTKDQKVTTAITLPVAVTVHEVLPHMHLLGTEMHVEAELPDGTKRDIIYVKNWEFQWQMGYRFKEPVKLPKGTKVTVTSLYDNTTANPYQPSSPPKLVKFGEQSTDEMCFAFLGFTVDKMGEENAIYEAGGAP